MYDFVHLHVHTEYSLLDGAAKTKDLIPYVASIGQNAVAMTDHGVLYGTHDFYATASKHKIKPIIGMEGYLAKGHHTSRNKEDSKPYHLLMLAMTNKGYSNLSQLSSIAFMDGFYYRPRIDKELLERYNQDIVITSGCLASPIPQAILNGREQDAHDMVRWFSDVFTDGRFYFEVQPRNNPDQRKVNKWVLEQSLRYNIPVIATTDAHYIKRSDAIVHDSLLCIQTGSLLSDTDRMKFDEDTYYIATGDEIASYFSGREDVVSNTVSLADKLNVNFSYGAYHMPEYHLPEGYTYESYLRHLVEIGLQWRYGERANSQEVRERVEYELEVIEQMKFPAYFLVVWDICAYAHNNNIWYNARGSAAGSVVAYALGITSIEPMSAGLYFERFLNPERKTMPDIDLDFEDHLRERMIEYLVKRYGSEHVASIITFGVMQPRAALRNAARIHEIPTKLVDELSNAISPHIDKDTTLDDLLQSNPVIKDGKNNDTATLTDWLNRHPEMLEAYNSAIPLQGYVQNAGKHAAGVVITKEPVINYSPLYRVGSGKSGNSADESCLKQSTQFDMETIEKLGVLKVDFLGLKTLQVVHLASELIYARHGHKWNLDNIPYLSNAESSPQMKRVYQMLIAGYTTGVFQLESDGMSKVISDMKPSDYEHIVAAISLYRPGPLQFIKTYIDRMHGKEKVEYLHPKLKETLHNTYGICVAGDTEVFDVVTGSRYRVDELDSVQGRFNIQTIDDNFNSTTNTVTHWINNGIKPVYKLKLRNGASIKATKDHKFLTESGWCSLENLQKGDYLATPPQLLEPTQPINFDRRKLRVLAYIMADGGVSNQAQVNFFSKDVNLIEEYGRCLSAFDDVIIKRITQVRGVIRVTTRQKNRNMASSLLTWMRQLGYKKPVNQAGGLSSHEKFVPDFVFNLSNKDIAYFIASLWDCDGYVDNKLCHYKTISPRLARDVQTLLLRLGFTSTIYEAPYVNSKRENQVAYQVTLYDTANFAKLIQPMLITPKKDVSCNRSGGTTIERSRFIEEVKSTTNLSARQLMLCYGIDRKHFYPKKKNAIRIKTKSIGTIADVLPLPITQRHLRIQWEEIVSIEYAGEENVYDITVDTNHNFVANGIITHNCIYQEQIMSIARELFGYRLGEADLMRRAVSKKKKEDLDKHRQIFRERGPQNGVSVDIADKIFDQIAFFANYGFNRSHASDYAKLSIQTAYLKTHYPSEYMTALLIAYNGSDRMGALLDECQKLGIKLLTPDLTSPSITYTLTPDGIRYGLSNIKHVGESVASTLMNQYYGSNYDTLEDLMLSVDLSAVNSKALDCLIKTGAFDKYGSRQDMLNAIEHIREWCKKHHRKNNKDEGNIIDNGMLSMFSAEDFGVTDDELKKGKDKNRPPKLADILFTDSNTGINVTDADIMAWEKELLGITVTVKQSAYVRDMFSGHNTMSISELNMMSPNGKMSVKIGGKIASLKTQKDKNGKQMATFKVQDWRDNSEIRCTVFATTYTKVKGLLEDGGHVVISGKADASYGKISVIVDSIKKL